MKKFSDLPKKKREFDRNGVLTCSFNKLTSLEGAPEKIDGDFDCSWNELTSLEGAPKEVDGFFACSHNHQLTSLKGAPKEVNGVFDCSENRKLTSLKYAPKEVNGTFYCYDNELTSLKEAPKKVNGNFDCTDNPLKTIKDLKDTKGIKTLELSESDYMKMYDYLEDIFNHNIKCEFIKIKDEKHKILLDKEYIEAKIYYVEKKFNILD